MRVSFIHYSGTILDIVGASFVSLSFAYNKIQMKTPLTNGLHGMKSEGNN